MAGTLLTSRFILVPGANPTNNFVYRLDRLTERHAVLQPDAMRGGGEELESKPDLGVFRSGA